MKIYFLKWLTGERWRVILHDMQAKFTPADTLAANLAAKSAHDLACLVAALEQLRFPTERQMEQVVLGRAEISRRLARLAGENGLG